MARIKKDMSTLDEDMLAKIRAASESGEPIRVVRNSKFPANLKQALGLPFNEGELCTRLKRFVTMGVVVEQDSGEIVTAYGSPGVIHSRVIALEPA